MKTYPVYAGGVFRNSPETMDVLCPYTGQVFAKVSIADQGILEQAISAAIDVQVEMASLPSYEKFEALRYISDAIHSNRIELATILCLESAKPMKYSLGEVDRAAQTFLIAAEESKRLPEEYIRMDWTAAAHDREAIVKSYPIGIIAGISPFNFPLNLPAHKIAPAIATGCPIILKPASKTPLSTFELAKIIDQTNLPKGAVSILPMNREVGNLMVKDDRFSLLSFTGSPAVGWKMKMEAGNKKVVLELGGNAGVLVNEDADLKSIIPACIMGAFAYSGQVCIHAQRIYIHENVFETFLDLFIAATENIRIGDPNSMETDVSSMIDEENAIRVENWVNEAIEGGAKLLTGGGRNGSVFEPTVLTDTNTKMKVCAEEVFGPVVIIESVSSFEEGINKLNDSKFGLQAGIFTDNVQLLWKAFDALKVGGVIHNDVPTFRADHMPYGGVKESGLGREGVKYAMRDMLEPKVLVLKR